MLTAALLTLIAIPVPEEVPDAPSLAERQLVMVQGDLSFVGNLGPQSMAGGALYFGLAYGFARPPGFGPFAGVGFEGTYAGAAEPYRISLGLQIRGGIALVSDDTPEGHQTPTGQILPDLTLYGRVSVFAAGTSSVVGTGAMVGSMPVSRTFAGLRAGLGLTSTFLTRRFFSSGLFSDSTGFWFDALRVGVTVLLLPIVLLDHTEVMFEFADIRPILATVTFRVGAGF